jgi:anti-sigma factor RsiW
MITRDNYEEFFLLYTDNELPASERHEVERFVADHPDLREEWEALLQCRLSPDTHLSFPDRESLLKPELEGSAYTGALLSYIDGELNKEDTLKIEAILHEQPLVANELAVLRQLVFRPDPDIVFPGKDRLYRTEKERRIIPLPWIRTGIAAAIAGAIALILLLPANHRRQAPVAVNHLPATTNKISPAVTPPPVTALHSIERQPVKTRPVKQIIQKRESQQEQDVAAVNRKIVTPMVTRSEIDPARHIDPAKEIDPVREIRQPDPVTTISIGSRPATGDLAADIHPAVQTGIPKDQSSFATLALQEQDGDQRKPALRGIFRKVTRAFGKTADRDNDGNRQVLVGAFQVSLD